MQVLRAILLRAAAQSVPKLFRPLRPEKKSIQQRAKIESGSSADNGQASALPALMQKALTQNDLAQNQPRLARIFSGANVGARIHAIQQVMRNFRALRRAGLGRANIKFAVHRNRVAVDNLTAEAPRDGQRQSRLPASLWTNPHSHDRLEINFGYLRKRKRAPQEMTRQ